MSAVQELPTPPGSTEEKRKRRRPRSRVRGREGIAGWLFLSPAVIILGVFLVIPIVLALYVSFTNWNGQTNPLAPGGAHWVGLSNYSNLITKDSLTRLDFATSIRNNFYYVLLVVPLQTALALFLAVILNDKYLKGRSFFRTAFYFPSITSSVAITLVFLFLFSVDGAVNTMWTSVGLHPPNWLINTNGLFHNVLGVIGINSAPGWAKHSFFGLSWWDWLAGPSVGMCVLIILAVFTTSGTFMLLFIAALQGINGDIEEACELDGASGWQRFRFVTLPMLRPTLVLVLTLGLIGTWQVFDQAYLAGQSNPTIITPSLLSYQVSFNSGTFGVGSAIAFLLFVLIVVMTVLQRRLLPEDIES